MRRYINNFISVGYSALRIAFLKLILRKGFFVPIIQRISPNVVLEFNKGSRVKFGRTVRIHSGTKIKVRSGAKLEIGDNVKVNYYCIVACHDEITIGEGTEFGPSVYLYDHDHDYRVGLHSNSKKEEYKSSPIVIGKNCWIGANTVILRGTVLGDNCVVGSGCVLNGEYEANSLIVQKRETMVREISVEQYKES